MIQCQRIRIQGTKKVWNKFTSTIFKIVQLRWGHFYRSQGKLSEFVILVNSYMWLEDLILNLMMMRVMGRRAHALDSICKRIIGKNWSVICLSLVMHLICLRLRKGTFLDLARKLILMNILISVFCSSWTLGILTKVGLVTASRIKWVKMDASKVSSHSRQARLNVNSWSLVAFSPNPLTALWTNQVSFASVWKTLLNHVLEN